MALRLQAELGGDGTGFDRMMNRAGAQVNRFASAGIAPLKNLIAGAFSVGAITQITRSIIEFASHLRDTSDQLGVNVEWLQEMGFVAKQNGATIDDLEKTLLKINEARSAALGGGGQKQMAAFQKFGIGPQEIQSGRLTGIMDKIAKAFETGSQQELEPAFRAIGGRGAAVLIPSFLEGIERGREAARESGAVMAEDTIDQLDDIDDQFAILGMRLKGQVGPAILSVANFLMDLWKTLKVGINYITAFISSVSLKDVASAFLHPFTKNEGVANALETAKDAATEEIASQMNQEDADKRAREAMRKRRRQRETGPIEMQPLEPEKFKFAKNSDNLSTVGNFLGGSGVGSDLVKVGEKTNMLLAQTNATLNTIANNTGRSNMPDYSGVPR